MSIYNTVVYGCINGGAADLRQQHPYDWLADGPGTFVAVHHPLLFVQFEQFICGKVQKKERFHII